MTYFSNWSTPDLKLALSCFDHSKIHISNSVQVIGKYTQEEKSFMAQRIDRINQLIDAINAELSLR